MQLLLAVPSFEEYCEWANQYGFMTNVEELRPGIVLL